MDQNKFQDDKRRLNQGDYTLLIFNVQENHARDISRIASALGARGATSMLGKGVLLRQQAKLMGLPLEVGRELVLMAVRRDRARNVMNAVYDELGIKRDARGYMLEIPLIAAYGISIDKNEDVAASGTEHSAAATHGGGDGKCGSSTN